MQAIRVHEFGGPEVLRLEELPDPHPAAGQVRVRVEAAGVNPVDTYVRAGMYGPRPFPFIAGFDGAGVVDEVGPDVASVRVGDRVYFTMVPSYATSVVAPASAVWPLPSRLDFAQGAAIGIPYATALKAVHFVGRLQPGDWVLVHGASGAVGTAALQLGAAAGLRMVATASTEAGRSLALALGAECALGHDDLEEALARTHGHGFDAVIELAAHLNLGRDLGILAHGGQVVVVGSRGPVEIDARRLMNVGGAIRALSIVYTTPEERERLHLGLAPGLRSGVLTPVVGRTLPLAQAAEAHRLVMAGGSLGKLVLLTGAGD